MKDVKKSFKEFVSLKGYFLADRKALAFIKRNYDAWDITTLNSKFGVLGLKQLVPDYLYKTFLQAIADSNIRRTIQEERLDTFEEIVQKLTYHEGTRFILSLLMCAHRPDYFPIWDEKKPLISGWENELNTFSYGRLKHRINVYKGENELYGLDYYYFNKLLWYCQ